MRSILVVLAAPVFLAACDPSPTRPTRTTSTADQGAAGGPRINVSGNYTLTIAAAHGCAAGFSQHLPEAARVRTYQAAVQQNGSVLEVTVSGPTIRYGFFIGMIQAERVVFDLAWYNDGGPSEHSIIERLSTSKFLSVGGLVTTTGSTERLAGALDGDFHILETEDIPPRPIAQCSSQDHQFVLSR